MIVFTIGTVIKRNAKYLNTIHNLCQTNTLKSFANKTGIRRYSDVRIPERFRKKSLPFEQESEQVAHNILLYSCYQSKRTAILISVGGTFLGLVLLQSADLIYRYSGAVKIQAPDDIPWYMWWMKVDYSSNILKTTMISIMLIAATLVFGFSMVYPSRMVREIQLMRGGKTVILRTYGPFGKIRSMQIPVNNVSAQWGQEKAHSVLPLKIKGKRLMFQLYPKEGIVHNQPLFDSTICRFRF